MRSDFELRSSLPKETILNMTEQEYGIDFAFFLNFTAIASSLFGGSDKIFMMRSSVSVKKKFLVQTSHRPGQESKPFCVATRRKRRRRRRRRTKRRKSKRVKMCVASCSKNSQACTAVARSRSPCTSEVK